MMGRTLAVAILPSDT